MPELITASLVAPPPSQNSSPSAAGKSGAGSSAKAAEGNKSEADSAAKESSGPFATALQKQMAKKDAGSTTAAPATTAKPAPGKPEVSTLPADLTTAALANLAAMADKLGNVLPKEATETTEASDAAATTVDALLAQLVDPAAQQPVTIAVTPAVTANGAQLPAQAERDTKKHGLPEAVAGLGDLKPVLEDGKIALDAAITAETARRDKDHGDTSFQVLIDSRNQQAQAPQTAASSQVSSAPVLRIDTPVGQAGWQEEMGQKLTWMAAGSRQQADLVLTPPNMGRVEVSLTINGDQATAVFGSTNSAVRDLIEDSLPRLREILAESGINLGQTHVGSESASQFANNQDNRGFRGNKDSDEVFPGAASAAERSESKTGFMRASAGRGMVDIFA